MSFTSKEIYAIKAYLQENCGIQGLSFGIARDVDSGYQLAIQSHSAPLEESALKTLADKADAYAQAHFQQRFDSEDINYRHAGPVRILTDLSEAVKAKIHNPRLEEMLANAAENSRLHFDDRNRITVHFTSPISEEQALNALRGAGIHEKEGQAGYLRSLPHSQTAIFTPQDITAGQLVALIDSPQVKSVTSVTEQRLALSHVAREKIKDPDLKRLFHAQKEAVLNADEHQFTLWLDGDMTKAKATLESFNLPVRQNELQEHRLVKQVRYRPEAIPAGKLVEMLEDDAVVSLQKPFRPIQERSLG